MKAIISNRCNINYQLSGHGGVTLLFVHGSFNDHSIWNEQVKHFNNAYTVVTFDLPGHGQSAGYRELWSIETFAEDVIAIIKALELKNVVIIGHSYGAAISLSAVTRHPAYFRGIIAIDYFKNAGQPMSPDYKHQEAMIKEKLTTNFANTNEQFARMALLTEKTSPQIVNRIVQEYRHANQAMAMQTIPELFSLFLKERELLPKLSYKLNLINADYSPTNTESLQTYTAPAGYQLFTVPGTCHFPMLENPTTLNSQVQAVLQQITTTIPML